MVMNETTPVKLPDLSNWTKVPAGYVVQTGGPYAILDEEGDIAYVSASKIGFTVTPVEAVYVPPRQLPTAPGSVVKARFKSGSWDIWFLINSATQATRPWLSPGGKWAGPDELSEWELIHDEGATQ